MPTGKKKETKTTKKRPASVTSNESSIMTRLEVVEKMLLITRDDIKEMRDIFERIRNRMGL